MEPSHGRFDQTAFNSSTTPLPKVAPKLITGITMALSPTPRALLFDVFGTCVNWRKSIVSALCDKAHESLNAATASLASQLRLRASAMTEEHWGQFAQEWRDSYKTFTKKLAADPSCTWMTVDEHHHKSLQELLAKWELQGLWDDREIRALSLAWHHLAPWDDSVLGVKLLNQLFGRSRPAAWS
jgi:2-haloacid dehalogenase